MPSLISAKDIAFSYDDHSVLDRVSFTARDGEFIGLIGPNGSGKTTLLRLLLGLLSVRSGEILLCGKHFKNMSRKEVAKKITLVPQDTLMDLSFRVREIVAMGRTPYLGRFRPEGIADKAAITYALQVTETEPFAERFVTELSGGERQRVIIARAIAQETPVMLFDEPTSNLDVVHQLEVLALIRNLAHQGRCAIASLHDLSLAARFCDRILLLSKGELVADDTPREVMTESNLAHYFGIDVWLTRDDKNGDLMIWPLAPIKNISEHR